MTKNSLICTAALSAIIFSANFATAQQSTPPATPAELEAVYTTAIEGRATDILKPLALDESKSNEVHDIIVAQYRALRARDEVIDTKLKAGGKEVNYANRAAQLQVDSKTLHDNFLAKLAADLTPEQVDAVENKMTYNKVKVTYDAYCAIVPNLTDADKAKIMELLKAAREDAIDGGSAPEKSAIFQSYKDKINAYLDANGHDTAQAFRDWNAKQELASKKDAAATTTTPAAK